MCSAGDSEPPAAREVVTLLILHFLATGARLDVPRLRCKDVAESGRWVTVTFNDGTLAEAFLSRKGFQQLLGMKAGTNGRKPQPKPVPATPVHPRRIAHAGK